MGTNVFRCEECKTERSIKSDNGWSEFPAGWLINYFMSDGDGDPYAAHGEVHFTCSVECRDRDLERRRQALKHFRDEAIRKEAEWRARAADEAEARAMDPATWRPGMLTSAGNLVLKCHVCGFLFSKGSPPILGQVDIGFVCNTCTMAVTSAMKTGATPPWSWVDDSNSGSMEPGTSGVRLRKTIEIKGAP